MKKITRRNFMQIAGTGVAAMALASCVESANSTSTATSTADSSSDASSEEASAGNDSHLIVASGTLGNTLDPILTTDTTASSFIYGTYENLIRYTIETREDGTPAADVTSFEPSLAKSWDTSDDGLVWTFYLDPDAKFANGDSVTAEDVIYSYEVCRDSAEQSFFFGITFIDNMEIIDDLTVQFTLYQPCGMFLRLLEIYPFAIKNKAQAEAGLAEDDLWLNNNTCGSGPYQVVTFDTTAEVTLERRDDYWAADRMPVNKTVTYQYVPETSQRVLLLESGDVDISLGLEIRNYSDMKAAGELCVHENASNMFMMFCMNNNMAPFDDPMVRMAFAYAAPYDDLVNEVLEGGAVRMTSFLPDNVSGHIAIEGETYVNQDIEMAKSLLAEAGYEDGFSFTATIGDGYTEWDDAAIVIQAALASAGVNMEIKSTVRATFLEEAGERGLLAFLNRFNPFIGDPGYVVGNVFDSAASFNYFNYSNPEFDDLYVQAEAAVDADDRFAYYEEMQKVFFQDMPVVPLYQSNFTYASTYEVQGYVFYPDQTIRFAYMYK